MDPITAFMAMSTAGKAMAVGTAMSAVGAVAGGYAQKSQAEAQAKAAEYNANLTKMQADVERSQSAAREEQQLRRGRQVLGAQRAAIAQAGAGFGGSMADIMEESATAAELDALTMRYEGDLRSKGLLAQAEGDLYGARAARAAGKQAVKAGWISAGASALTGYGMYNKP